jgi:galactose-1-phosphate uridylyltransferase
MLTQRRPSAPKRIPHFHDDYELGEMQKFQGGVHLTFREKKFVVKIMKLEDWKKKGRGNITWEKLLQIKRGQSEIMMSNVHPLIVKHYASYEDEEAHELYVSTTSLHLPSSLTPCACTS